MRLYVHPLSSNSRRATLVARHLDLDIELVSVALESGAQKSANYLRLNPNGRVPLLIDGDFGLWESHAIMQYLADRAGADDIYPREVQARGDVNRWLFWSACHFAPACALFIRERVSKKVLRLGEADPAEIARGEAQRSAPEAKAEREPARACFSPHHAGKVLAEGCAHYIGISIRVYRNPAANVIAATAQIGHINQRRSCSIEFGNENIFVAKRKNKI